MHAMHVAESMKCSNLCYTLTMVKYPYIWRNWASRLHSWGLNSLAASFLEAAGPLTMIGAQVIYVSQPILGAFIPKHHLEALADILEEPEHTRMFAQYLQRETDS